MWHGWHGVYKCVCSRYHWPYCSFIADLYLFLKHCSPHTHMTLHGTSIFPLYVTKFSVQKMFSIEAWNCNGVSILYLYSERALRVDRFRLEHHVN